VSEIELHHRIRELEAEVAYLKDEMALMEQTLIAMRTKLIEKSVAKPLAKPDAEPPVFVRFNSSEPPNG
jgi:hypothetical protein